MRPVALFAVALLAASCSPSVQPQTPSPQPAHGAVARVELSSNPGTGSSGGTAAITARVLDAYGALLANQAVTFATSVGTFSEASALTNEQGIAHTTLNAPAGNASVTARAGDIQTTPLVIAVQPLITPSPPTPNPPTPTPEPNPSPQPTGPLTVTLLFTAGQAGTPTTFALSLQGGLSSARWSFGDGASVTSSLPTIEHIYASAGVYVASVTVTDRGGRVASDTQTVAISAAPIPPTPQPAYTSVTMTASPTTVTAGGSITYSASVIAVNGAPAPNSYAWDCKGDSALLTRTTVSSFTCVYPVVGTFTAVVVASNGEVSAMGSRSVNITAVPVPPPPTPPTIAVNCSTGTHTATPSTCLVIATVNGVVVPSAQVTSVSWDFGDGVTATVPGNTATHTYASANTFTVFAQATVTGVTGTVNGSTTTTILP